MKIMRFVRNWLYHTFTQAGKSEKAGKHLDDLMKEGEPGWGWANTDTFKLFDYVCTQGGVRIPLSMVSARVIHKAVKKYRLSAIFEGDHAWVGIDSKLLIRRMRESRRSSQAI